VLVDLEIDLVKIRVNSKSCVIQLTVTLVTAMCKAIFVYLSWIGTQGTHEKAI